MRKIAAQYIFPVSKAPLKNGTIILQDDGTIVDVIDTGGNLQESENLEFYNGIIVPGFVNTHCHLELSHLKGKVEEGTGLVGFLDRVQKLKKTGHSFVQESMQKAEEEMIQGGIVAVGDISNTADSFEIKQNSRLRFHTFIELIGLLPNQAMSVIEKGINLRDAAREKGLSASLGLHAPYSVSLELFSAIGSQAILNDDIISFHSLESEDEELMYHNKSGKFLEMLASFGIDISQWNAPGESPLRAILPLLPATSNVLLVHNIYATEEEIKLASAQSGSLFWVTCPNSNLYIEKALPPLLQILQWGKNVTIGTDSLSSNKTLSILDEMKTISTHFNQVELDELLKWATLNGAKALKMDKELGSIEKGKKPGLNLLSNIDFEKMKLTATSTVKVIA